MHGRKYFENTLASQEKEIIRVKNRSLSGTEGVQPLKLYFHFSFQLSKRARKFWESGRVSALTRTQRLVLWQKKYYWVCYYIKSFSTLISAHTHCFPK